MLVYAAVKLLQALSQEFFAERWLEVLNEQEAVWCIFIIPSGGPRSVRCQKRRFTLQRQYWNTVEPLQYC